MAKHDPRNDEEVIRYVVTYENPTYGRTLVGASQGRNTYATPEEAQALLDAMIKNNGPETLARHFPGELKVMPCPCWPGHFDPKRIYFSEPDGG